MSSFELLHPALQHHIVNSLRWRQLRPFQEAVIPRLLEGEHLVVLAPTAGGKTEAAIFPVLSRMLSEGWAGLSVLYVCPIKALLNNLDARLSHYYSLVGRRSGLWHGDVGNSARKRLLLEPPDCLLTTPESLEVMLMSRRVDQQFLFAGLKAIVVDEIHAFAGDDRGWHLLSVLQRISRIAGREIQRIGLSATVGNPEALADWLAGGCQGKRGVYLPPPVEIGEHGAARADVQLDYVGSLDNAATVISRLHRGEKRLVFVDSRARAEELGTTLRGFDIETFVTHSALSQEERHRTEAAFASRQNCVIVATSVLELGIDVGDLDRVIQIDAPPSVASFLQRMGRTGRRSGSIRNCLILATKPKSLVQAAALIRLWSDRFVEPIVPPPEPYHILSQQLMAIAIQEGGIACDRWYSWLRGIHGFDSLSPERIFELTDWMISSGILHDDGGLLWLGESGERTYGHKNFMQLFSVFASPPMFRVFSGRTEIGQVEDSSFLGKQEGKRIISLGGRFWQVNHIDWQRKRVYVEPTEEQGKSSWFGSGWGLNHAICQAMRDILVADGSSGADESWSRRATEQLRQVRQEFGWLSRQENPLVKAGDQPWSWWTFAGSMANATLAQRLAASLHDSVQHDGFALNFPDDLDTPAIIAAIEQLKSQDIRSLAPDPDERALRGLKFSDCLPLELARHVLSVRLRDDAAVQATLAHPMKVIRTSEDAPNLLSRRTRVAHGPKQAANRQSKRVRTSPAQISTTESAINTPATNPQPPEDRPHLALSIRQPWAEQIMRGDKTVEYRSQPTRVRGRVYIYASLGRYDADREQAMQVEFGIELDSLPRGVLIGTVELYACRPSGEGDYEWMLRMPERLDPPLNPTSRANPVWFRPFG